MHQMMFPCGFVTLFGVTSMVRKFNLGLNLTPPPFPCPTHSLKKMTESLVLIQESYDKISPTL